jgi:DNA invertase Pin-like site-specific DNA recombinase
MVIRHKCDNPHCINVEHLEIGTHADNMRDMAERGRVKRPVYRTAAAKINAEQAREIRSLLVLGKSRRELSKLFGISIQSIGRIVRNEAWRNLQ